MRNLCLTLALLILIFASNSIGAPQSARLSDSQQALLEKLETEGALTPEEKAQLHRWNILRPDRNAPNRDGRGGPDEYGYRWIDSDEEDAGVEYDWIEIREIGETVDFRRDDQTRGWFDIGFDFEFYGRTYDRVKICTNGFISFTEGWSGWDHRNREFPDGRQPKNVVAPLWIDLLPDPDDDRIYYWTNEENNMFIVEWDSIWTYPWQWYGDEEENGGDDDERQWGPKTFQLILYANGMIKFQYLDGNTPMDQGVIGIQNHNGGDGLTVASNEHYLHSEMAVLIWHGFGSVEGTVHSAEDEEPVAGAMVSLSNGMETTVDEAGNFSFQNVMPDSYTLTVSYNGFQEYSQEIEVESGETTSLEIQMDPVEQDEPGEYDTPGTANSIFAAGDRLFLADGENGLLIFDISDPDNIRQIGEFNTDGDALGVYVSGDYAFIADGPNGLVILDISDVEDIQLTGHYNSDGISYYVYVYGEYAYVCDGQRGFQKLDISEIDDPRLSGRYNTPGIAVQCYVEGDYAYVADMNGGFFILDISGNPLLVNSYDTEGTVYSLKIIGHYACLVDGDGGLVVLDIEDFENIELVDTHETPGAVISMFYLAGYLYLIDDQAGFIIVDITDPLNPVAIGEYEHENARWIWVIGDYAYIAVGEGGFVVYDLSQILGQPLRLDVISPENGDEFAAADTMRFEWEVESRYGLERTVLQYKNPDDNRWVDIVTLENGETEYNWEIPGLYSNSFRIRVKCFDSRGNHVQQVIRNIVIYEPQDVAGSDFYSWNLISLPLNPTDPAIEQVIGDDVEHPGIYAMYHVNMRRGVERIEETECGPGYWLVIDHDTSRVDMEGAANVDTFTYMLDRSWNMIGCPFPTSIALSSALFRWGDTTLTQNEAADAAWIIPTLWGHRQTRGYFQSQEFDPWHGYWFMCLVDDLEMLLFPPGENDNPGRDAPDDAEQWQEWEFHLRGSMLEGEVWDEATVGASLLATDGFDIRYDYPEPTYAPFDAWIRMYFTHNDWIGNFANEFNRDMRSYMNDVTQEWNLTVETNDSGEVTVTWGDLLAKSPAEYTYILIDPVENIEVNLMEEDSYTFSKSEENYPLRIRVTAPLSAEEQTLLLPTDFEVLNAYPNPFNSSVSIRCNILHPADVNLRLFDLRGNLVQKLFAGKMNAGSHQIIWNGNSEPAGVYVLRLNASGRTASKKLLLLR